MNASNIPNAETARKSIDEAAFGVIYGSITVMGVLIATSPNEINPLLTTGMLFITVLAIAVTKAFADLAATVLTSERHASKSMIATSWEHSRTTLIAANGPTLAMLLSATGLYGPSMGLVLAQVLAIMLLLFYGARIGFRLTRRIVPAFLGAGFTGGMGLALSLLKNVLH